MARITMVALVALMLSAPVAPAQDGSSKAGATQASAAPIDINSATVPQLETLPGIGRATAERIVEYREKNGGFKKIEELMNVRGIGEKSFLTLKPLITIASSSSGGNRPRQ